MIDCIATYHWLVELKYVTRIEEVVVHRWVASIDSLGLVIGRHLLWDSTLRRLPVGVGGLVVVVVVIIVIYSFR